MLTSTKSDDKCVPVKPFPKLMYLSSVQDTSSIALMTNANTGTVVYVDSSTHKIGTFRDTWSRGPMSDYDGSICLN